MCDATPGSLLQRCTLSRMGIRYLARPIPPGLVATALVNPRLLFIDDEYAEFLDDLDDLDRAEGRRWPALRHTLDLDKTFHDFQRLWGPPNPAARYTHPLVDGVSGQTATRPAFRLVMGDVTHTARGGWRAHHGVLRPTEIEAIHDDIVATPDHEFAALIAEGRQMYATDDEAGYFTDLLRRRHSMVDFLAARMSRREGVLFSIG